MKKRLTSLGVSLNKMLSDLYDFSKLLKITKSIEDTFKCNNCKIIYNKKWSHKDSTICYYCNHFMPMRDTYSTILGSIDWHYIRSGEISRREYYTAFIDNLQKWCIEFSIIPSKQDKQYEEELLQLDDWTRHSWH